MFSHVPPGVTPRPVTYGAPVKRVEFAHVGLIEQAQLNWLPDPDNQGLVLTAAIPRSAAS